MTILIAEADAENAAHYRRNIENKDGDIKVQTAPPERAIKLLQKTPSSVTEVVVAGRYMKPAEALKALRQQVAKQLL